MKTHRETVGLNRRHTDKPTLLQLTYSQQRCQKKPNVGEMTAFLSYGAGETKYPYVKTKTRSVCLILYRH